MKKQTKKLGEFLKQLQENPEKKLEGGFLVLSSLDNHLVIGGENTNNCNGGNCIAGCGTNQYQGCGGSAINTVPGCGKN